MARPNGSFGAGFNHKNQTKKLRYDLYGCRKTAGRLGIRAWLLGGANMDWKALSVGAIDYYCADVINIFYTEAKYALLQEIRTNLPSLLRPDQRSTGENLIAGGPFSAGQWGVKTDFGLGDAVFAAGFTDVTSSNTNKCRHPGAATPATRAFKRRTSTHGPMNLP